MPNARTELRCSGRPPAQKGTYPCRGSDLILLAPFPLLARPRLQAPIRSRVFDALFGKSLATPDAKGRWYFVLRLVRSR
jgi:hypothetical protein